MLRTVRRELDWPNRVLAYSYVEGETVIVTSTRDDPLTYYAQPLGASGVPIPLSAWRTMIVSVDAIKIL